MGRAAGTKAENAHLWQKHQAKRAIGNAKSLKSQSPQNKTTLPKSPHSAAITEASVQMTKTGGHLIQTTPARLEGAGIAPRAPICFTN